MCVCAYTVGSLAKWCSFAFFPVQGSCAQGPFADRWLAVLGYRAQSTTGVFVHACMDACRPAWTRAKHCMLTKTNTHTHTHICMRLCLIVRQLLATLLCRGTFLFCLNIWLHGIIGHTSIGSDAGGGFRCAAVHQHSPTPMSNCLSHSRHTTRRPGVDVVVVDISDC